MTKILLFGGTSEEHTLLKSLSRLTCAVTLCVASEYGKSLIASGIPNLTVHVGRLDMKQIAHMIREGSYNCVVDATHPYATEVTQNIRSASLETGIQYFRLKRPGSELHGVTITASVQEAAEYIKKIGGNVLLTTGSKELADFTDVPEYEKRLFPRVLPSVESIEACLSAGFPSNHIIALQGPFSKELNIALMRQFDIKAIVTKDGGKPGGFPEKLEAARELGAVVIVIGRPDDEGLPQNELIKELTKLLEEKQ
jgi:precorrin-6x reductase